MWWIKSILHNSFVLLPLPCTRFHFFLLLTRNSIYLMPNHIQAHQFLFETKGFTAEMCMEPESLLAAYQLRYRAYRHAESIPPNDDQLFKDAYDDQANAKTFLIWHDNRAIASLRICIWSATYAWQSTEMIHFYPSDIQRHIGLDLPMQESCRYVVDPEIKGRVSLNAQLLMFRIHAIVSKVEGSKFILTGVRKKHSAFYQRMLAFKPLSEPRYVDWIDEDVVLLATPRDTSYETFLSKGGEPITQADCDRYIHLTKAVSQTQTIPSYAGIFR